jgi:RNA polymerase sigma factor (sigma-70 family)
MKQAASHSWDTLDPARLAAERDRLVRYCLRVVRDPDVAEDLAQETLITAWRSRDRLRDGMLWQAWLTGIARHVCLRWIRRQTQDRARFPREPFPASPTPSPFPLDIPDESLPDPVEALERDDVALLLDRAMATLPVKARGLLVERYVDDLPVAEIAARRGIIEETAAMQLHRGRLALRKALTTRPDLREEAVNLGLVTSEAAEWQQTQIWCPRCGAARLRGRLGTCDKDWNGKPNPNGPHTIFHVVCPHCDDENGAFVHMAMKPEHDLLKGIKGFKPALNRVGNWFHAFGQEAARSEVMPCMRCKKPVPVLRQYPESAEMAQWRGKPGLLVECSDCRSYRAIGVPRLAITHPETSAFWRRYTRIRTGEPLEMTAAVGPVFITHIEAVNSRARLDVICLAKTLEVIEVQRTA